MSGASPAPTAISPELRARSKTSADEYARAVLLVGAILLAVFVLSGPWEVVVVAGAAVVEVAETAFWIWLSRRRRPRVGAETLIGARATAVTPCRPEGQVRIDGELWQARSQGGADAGDLVRVQDRDGLTLIVEREPR